MTKSGTSFERETSRSKATTLLSELARGRTDTRAQARTRRGRPPSSRGSASSRRWCRRAGSSSAAPCRGRRSGRRRGRRTGSARRRTRSAAPAAPRSASRSAPVTAPSAPPAAGAVAVAASRCCCCCCGGSGPGIRARRRCGRRGEDGYRARVEGDIGRLRFVGGGGGGWGWGFFLFLRRGLGCCWRWLLVHARLDDGAQTSFRLLPGGQPLRFACEVFCRAATNEQV